MSSTLETAKIIIGDGNVSWLFVVVLVLGALWIIYQIGQDT